MTKFLAALMLFAALALVGAPLMAQCGGCGGCDSEKKEAVETKVAPNTFTVAIEGMCCVKCAKIVEKKLKALENVESVVVDQESGKATVTMKEGKTLEKAVVEAALKDTEFKTTSVVKVEEKKSEDKKEG